MLYGFLTFLVVFYLGFCFFRKKNPYISTHKKKWQNEKDYEQYIKWLDNNGGDLPLPKIKFRGDIDLLNKVNKAINAK